VLDPALMAQVARHVEWLKHKHPEQRPENLNETLAHGDPFWLRLVSDDRLLDIAEKYVGKDIALFQSHYICKEPHDGEPVLWHQDGKASMHAFSLPRANGSIRSLLNLLS
jgi:phytanoyl-CoA hydroxylase